MTTPSPLVLINSTPQVNGVNVPKNSSVTVALASNAGVFTWDIVCVGTDENNTVASINATVSINHAINTATFTVPDGYGQAFIFQSIVNNGTDVNGVVQPSYTTTFGVYVLAVDGVRRVGAQNETVEGNSTYGWLTKFNPIFRQIPQVNTQIIANIQQISDGQTISPTTLFVWPNNTSAACHITLPSPAVPGSLFIVGDPSGKGSLNNIVISPNFGQYINGVVTPYTISTNYGAVGLLYVSSGGLLGWTVIWTKV